MFCLVVYSISFYPLINRYSAKSSGNLLLSTKILKKRPSLTFFIESFLILGQKIIKSLIHSNVLLLHLHKLILLIIVNVLINFFSLKLKKVFYNNGIFIFTFCYTFLFICLNSLLLKEYIG